MVHFERELKLRVEYVDGLLKEKMAGKEGLQKTVIEAMEYAVLAGGKRIRPILMWETYRLFGGRVEEEIRPFMAAMEMVHTYSLIHDDLPCMDDDDTRRGRKTTHIVYGEAMGLLAGDALLNYAFETISSGLGVVRDKARGIHALEVFAVKSGIFGMIGGQVVDVERMGSPLTLKTLRFIYEKKTCALLEASMMIGAILAGAGEKEVAGMEKAARNIGLAFQIRDDVLDVSGEKEVLGKPIGSDERNQKTTYVTLLGLEDSKKAVREYSEKAVNALKELPYQNDFLLNLVEWLIDREK